jgi:hypothetical protein
MDLGLGDIGADLGKAEVLAETIKRDHQGLSVETTLLA